MRKEVKPMMKRITAMLLAFALAAMLLTASSAAGTEAEIILDGKTLGAGALVDGTSVSLPVRDVCKALGYTVEWSDSGGERKVTVTTGSDTVIFNLTREQLIDNGHTFSAGTHTGGGIRLISGSIYIDSGLFSSIFPVSADYDPQVGRVTLTRIAENNVTVRTQALTAETAYLSAALQYPQLDGLADAAVQDSINVSLSRIAEDTLVEGRKNALDMAASVRDGYTGAVGKCETAFDYRVTYNQNELFSVVLMAYQYAGGAHGSTVQTAFTFDLTTGALLKLEDLLDETARFDVLVNAYIRAEIERRVEAGELTEFEFSPFSDIGENPGYYLSGRAVVIYFQQYEYFPYAAGIQEFAVPYEELSGLFTGPYSFLGGTVIRLKDDQTNKLAIGDIGRVRLQGNPSTGYAWYLTVSGDSMRPLSSWYESSNGNSLAGAGGMYVWNFKAVSTGKATLTFKYYREWEGEDTAEKTVVYHIVVI